MHYGITQDNKGISYGNKEVRNDSQFWVANEKWEIIKTSKSAYNKGDYSKVIYNFMKKHSLSVDQFRDKLNLCSPEEAKKRMENTFRLEKLKAEGQKFITDEEIDNTEGYWSKLCPDIYVPEKLSHFKLNERQSGHWLLSAFEETKHLKH